MTEEERFLVALQTRPLFHEALASAPSMDAAREIAKSHGFDVGESLIRASLLTHRSIGNPAVADLADVRGVWGQGCHQDRSTTGGDKPCSQHTWS